jgi:hypothetical protein
MGLLMAHKIDPIKITVDPWHGVERPVVIKIYQHELRCPRCNSPEKDEAGWHIRAFKVCTEDGIWHSECLVCKDAGLDGWFATDTSGE